MISQLETHAIATVAATDLGKALAYLSNPKPHGRPPAVWEGVWFHAFWQGYIKMDMQLPPHGARFPVG